MITYNDRIRRLLLEAAYTIEKHSTVRETAKAFGVSKSLVHVDMVKRLPKVDLILALKVEEVIQENKKERHIRGGEAFRRKWEEVKAMKQLEG